MKTNLLNYNLNGLTDHFAQMGEKQQFLSPKLAAALSAHGAALECMTTAAACRTYALLASEGRKVWAWLWV